MEDNLLIAVVGNRNSGKTTTWKELFGRAVKTGVNLRKLYITETEYVEVFLVSGSPEEREMYVGDLITVERPRIVLCSMQYIESARDTFNYFFENEYSAYTHWLNPGYSDVECKYFDSLGLVNWLLEKEHFISIKNAKHSPEVRVQQIKEHIYGWAKYRDLIFVDEGT
jgi:hypothetical protein